MKRLSIIIAVSNGVTYTKQAIDAIRLFVQQYVYEIILIDNASVDDTLEWANGQKDIVVIHNQENLGTGVAYNQGIGVSSGEMLLFLHNDVVLTKDVLQKMETALYQKSYVGAVGPLANRTYYGIQTIIADEYMDFAGMQTYADKISARQSKNHQTMLIENFCLLAKKEAVEKSGGFSQEYEKHYYEDLDFSLRMIKNGYRLVIAENAYVHHERGSFSYNGWNADEIKKHNAAMFLSLWGISPEYSTTARESFLNLMDLARKNLSVLEVGCAAGATLMRLHEESPHAKLVGIEFNAQAASLAASFAEVLAMDVEKLTNPAWDEQFDYVLLGDVLEHLHEPAQALANLYRVLKPGGKVIISIPNVLHISVVEHLLQGIWHYQDTGILDRTHLRFFTKHEILCMLTEQGFKIEYVAYRRVKETEKQQDLKKELCRLQSIDVDEEELEAYQWYIVARK